ncbi:amino acid adenylation domain-containing protein [Micromonospora sp. HM134]|uniref:non-ribosomal peptide synthetase n=1 Tax=Micromonospora sp. HM134 TaxID=2583243 RepID=UPI001198C650|nr:non-ribosomal peptide synthetase [Micromonospora sp. HM134]QDY07988.1 amino acid adenylation domain-containing protein [Micromonospora sp. HM134]
MTPPPAGPMADPDAPADTDTPADTGAAADVDAPARALDLDGEPQRHIAALAARLGGSGTDVLVAAVGTLLMRYTRRTGVTVALREPDTATTSAHPVTFPVDPQDRFGALVKTIESTRRSTGADGPVPAGPPGSGAPEPVAVVAGPGGSVGARVVLVPAQWPRVPAGQLARHLATLLREAAVDPDRQVVDLPLLDADELLAVIEDANRTVVSRPDRSTVAERVRRWADRQPDEPAVVAGDRRLSYAELLAAATRVATTLRGYGVERGDLVGLLLDRSPELVTCALGVLLAGGGYVGLDRDEPTARLATMLADADCRVLVTGPGAALPDDGVPPATRVVTVETLLTPPADPGTSTPEAGTPPVASTGDVCYVTFTSGSTGRPKAVLVPHDGVANLVDWYRETFEVRPGDRMPQLARPSFDGWGLEVWPCLANGGTLHLVDRRRLDSPTEFGDWLVERGITVCFLTTVLARELFTYPWPADRTRLRHLLLGGEKLHRYPPAGLPFRLYNVYGPTETTMLATCGEMDPADPHDVTPPIGRPLDNVRAYVLDERERPVPAGAVGELYLGGTGVARGYLGRPELTGQRFRPDPFTGPPGRMYATGDLVRRLPGGDLAFVGRADDQVKVRGFRIELGEIEVALRALPEVRDAAVVVRPGSPQDATADRLIGYVVPADPTRPPRADRLREELGRVLPPFMVPHLFGCLDAVPLTPHGKVAREELSRRPLPVPAADPPGTAPAGPAGLSPVEQLLVELWRETLDIDTVDREDSFFDLGGDSLQAMRVAARARERGLHFGAEDLFEHEILHELADALQQRGGPDRRTR